MDRRAWLEERRGALIMGILNRTPDSFSDGGQFVSEEAARSRIAELVAEGADLIAVGAASTRPGSVAIPAPEQIARIGGAVREACARGAVVSIDTTSPEVAAWALGEGASIINSVSLERAAELGALAAAHDAALVLMHCRGSMSDMPGFSEYADDAYGDVVAEVAREWLAAAEHALGAGLPAGDLLLDPGLGFAKNGRQSLELVAHLDELCALGYPVLCGPSRKSFVAAAAGRRTAEGRWPPPDQRLGASLAMALACVERGAAMVRVHDVGVTRQALDAAAAVRAVPPRDAPASRKRAAGHA